MIDEEKIKEEQRKIIQGYVPVVFNTKTGKEKYVSFDDKLTDNFLDAYNVNESEALLIAKQHCKFKYQIPKAYHVNGLCELVKKGDENVKN